MCILEKGQVINHIVTLYRYNNVVTVLEVVVLKWMFLILQSATKDRESRLCAMNKVRGCVTACCLYRGGVFHCCHLPYTQFCVPVLVLVLNVTWSEIFKFS